MRSVLYFVYLVLYWLYENCRSLTSSCKTILLAICLLSIHFLSAQNDIQFPSDLDSAKVDSFYTNLNIDLHQAKDPELYFEVYRWYHTCYRYGGNNTKGIDCSHFVNMLFEKIYGKTLESSAASIYTQCKPLKGRIKNAHEGDLLFFKIRKKHISHIGIYLGDGKFAHATTKLGVTISDLDEEYYRKRFYKAGRIQ